MTFLSRMPRIRFATPEERRLSVALPGLLTVVLVPLVLAFLTTVPLSPRVAIGMAAAFALNALIGRWRKRHQTRATALAQG